MRCCFQKNEMDGKHNSLSHNCCRHGGTKCGHVLLSVMKAEVSIIFWSDGRAAKEEDT